jgi:undecaprenyl-diphosphatase
MIGFERRGIRYSFGILSWSVLDLRPRPFGVISPTMILSRLDTRDRVLFLRCALADSSRRSRFLWKILTNAGSATCTILAVTLPLLLGGALAAVAERALVTLVVSHLLVQLVKRTVGRPRPSRGVGGRVLVAEPDRFSFPSGHATAAMSVAFVYATAYPSLALPLVAIAAAVGMSRVFLGVHYPGDVLIGQIIAVVTGFFALHVWQ